MNTSNDTSRGQKRNLWWIIAVATALIVGAIMGWFVFGGERTAPEQDDSASASVSNSASPTTEPSQSLSKYCKEKLNYAPNEKIAVTYKNLKVSSKTVEFEFRIKHESKKYVALDVGLALKFLKDGKDVTSELGDEFARGWDGPPRASVLPNAVSHFSDKDLTTPQGWNSSNIEFDVEIIGVGYWCVPKDKYMQGAA